VRDRKTFNIEYRIIRADGQVRWMSVMGGAVYDEATGEPVRVFGNSADVTERKLAEFALNERNLQLSLAGKAALVGSYAYDAKTETYQISEGYAAIHSLPEGTTTIGRSRWRASVHSYNVDYRIVRSGGEVRWIESRSFIAYDNDGKPQRVVGVSIDITGRKRAEDGSKLLNAELDHRVKNALATVSAVVS
jgi:PAS domain-containing protein